MPRNSFQIQQLKCCRFSSNLPRQGSASSARTALASRPATDVTTLKNEPAANWSWKARLISGLFSLSVTTRRTAAALPGGVRSFGS